MMIHVLVKAGYGSAKELAEMDYEALNDFLIGHSFLNELEFATSQKIQDEAKS